MMDDKAFYIRFHNFSISKTYRNLELLLTKIINY